MRTGTRPSAGQALPVPESLQEAFGDRLARLPSETGDVVLFAAALARPTIDAVATANGDRERVLDAVDIAAREGVIKTDGPRIRFAHPLLASICYEQAQVWKRHAVHQALAHSVDDVEERARHLALAAGADDAVASELDTAAEHAAARGAPATAGPGPVRLRFEAGLRPDQGPGNGASEQPTSTDWQATPTGPPSSTSNFSPRSHQESSGPTFCSASSSPRASILPR